MHSILLIEPRRLIGESLAAALSSTTDLCISEVAHSLESAASVVACSRPFSLALCNYELLRASTSVEFQVLCSKQQLPLVLLTQVRFASEVLSQIEAGAKGFLFWENSLDQMISGLRNVVKGERCGTLPPVSMQIQDPKVTQNLVSHALSASELETLRWLATGMTNKQIASTLGKSPETVKTQVTKILLKLKADTRTEAVTKATQLSLIDKLI